MHQLTGVIVFAKDKGDALTKARKTFDTLCDGRCSFDYHGLDHSDRYKPFCGKAESKRGAELVTRLHGFTLANLKEALGNIRESIESLSDEQIIESLGKDNKPEALIRYWFYEVGKYVGGSIHLYDGEAVGIRNSRQLADTLSKWKCLYEDQGKANPYAKLDVWIVAADTHY